MIKQKMTHKIGYKSILLLSLVLVLIAISILARLLRPVFTHTMINLNKSELHNSRAHLRKTIAGDSHIRTPQRVKAVYMSQCGAKSPQIRKHILDLISNTELNAVVIDIKDYTGTVSFPTTLPYANAGKGCVVKDMKSLIKDFHKHGIYVIGRITVFQDPLYARHHPDLAVQSKSKNSPWADWHGLHFIDVGARPFWKYILAISREAHQKYMFDELNFDYIRFPSDGPMRDAVYMHSDYGSRADELENFFRYLSYNVKIPDKAGHLPVISADLFGMTTTNYDDLTIGQVLERALPYFDFIAPMVYPSHYPSWFLGLHNPNKHVYTVVNYSMKQAVKRTVATSTIIASPRYTIWQKHKSTSGKQLYKKPAFDKNKLRPWLQDFDYGGHYDAKEVRAQIKAVYDAGLNSWMLWDPANIYTKEALLSSSE